LQSAGILFVIAGLAVGCSAAIDYRAVRQLVPQAATVSTKGSAASCIQNIGTMFMVGVDCSDAYRVALSAYAVGKVQHEEASERLHDVSAVIALDCAISLHADLPDARRVLAAALPAARIRPSAAGIRGKRSRR
jgi:hypothetical protein